MKDPVLEAPDENPVTSQIDRGTGKVQYMEKRSRKIRKLGLA